MRRLRQFVAASPITITTRRGVKSSRVKEPCDLLDVLEDQDIQRELLDRLEKSPVRQADRNDECDLDSGEDSKGDSDEDSLRGYDECDVDSSEDSKNDSDEDSLRGNDECGVDSREDSKKDSDEDSLREYFTRTHSLFFSSP